MRALSAPPVLAVPIMGPALETVFARWGEPTEPVKLSDRSKAFLVEQVGVPAPRTVMPVAQIHLPANRLPNEVATALAEAVGPEHVRIDRAARLAHAGGLSYLDLVRRREGHVPDAPDAVVAPASHEEVVSVLRVCAAGDVAVVPFGGGTSVVGGVTPLRGAHVAVIALAFDRLAELIDVDEDSCIATVGPGITGPVLERLLGARGLTLGHLPQSWQRATMGGYVATRSAGQSSSGYGRVDEMVESMKVATPSGSLSLGRAPASAAGPDLRRLFIGSEGVLGVITQASLRVRHVPAETRYEGVMFPSYESGIEAFQRLAQSRLTADVMRLSSVEETASTLAMSGPSGRVGDAFGAYLRARGVEHGSLAILGWEGSSAEAIAARRKPARSVLRKLGAVPLGRKVGESWRHGRFSGPFLRDTLMDEGYLVETIETATTWRELHALHATVLETLHRALQTPDAPGPLVLSHISHVYETGASLYVTVLAPADPADPVEQWVAAKHAVTEAVVASGATITHHHGVGTDHEPWMASEVGELGVDILRAVKQRLDPTGILNPGKLISARAATAAGDLHQRLAEIAGRADPASG